MKWNLTITDDDTQDTVIERSNKSHSVVTRIVDDFCMGLQMYMVINDHATTNRSRFLTVQGRLPGTSEIKTYVINTWCV